MDFSMFYSLRIRPISREKVRVQYSVKKNPHKFYLRAELLFESVEITRSIKETTKETELFPRPKLEAFVPGFETGLNANQN